MHFFVSLLEVKCQFYWADIYEKLPCCKNFRSSFLAPSASFHLAISPANKLKITSTFKMKFVNCFNIAHYISQHSKRINDCHVVKLYEYDLHTPLCRLLTFINSVTISNVFFAMFNIFTTFSKKIPRK